MKNEVVLLWCPNSCGVLSSDMPGACPNCGTNNIDEHLLIYAKPLGEIKPHARSESEVIPQPSETSPAKKKEDRHGH